MIVNAHSIVQLTIQLKNETMKHANVDVNITAYARKIIVGTCICENVKYLKSAVDDSKTVCDEIIYVMDNISINVTSTVSANVTSTMLSKFDDKKVRYKMDCYILHTVLPMIILLAIILQ